MPAVEPRWDVAIAGAGPAGLSAALVLGRCRRRVLLADAGTPRNHATEAMHGWIGHDGVAPAAFRTRAHAELARYPGVRFVPEALVDAAPLDDGAGFALRLAGGGRATARKLLLATGVLDALPAIPGLAALWGRSVHGCPYCDGWELSDAPLAAYGRRRRGLEMARALTAWSRDLVLCSDGPSGLGREDRAALAANGVRLVETPLARLEGRDGRLEALVFADGARIARRALFLDVPSAPQSALAARLGCAPSARGGVRAGRLESTTVPGVFVAGNIVGDVQQAIVAAAEGTKAAFGINRSLTREDFVQRSTGERIVEHPPVAEPLPSDAAVDPRTDPVAPAPADGTAAPDPQRLVRAARAAEPPVAGG
jgi:thioredoxin reductase